MRSFGLKNVSREEMAGSTAASVGLPRAAAPARPRTWTPLPATLSAAAAPLSPLPHACLVAQMVFSSSCTVYGLPEEVPITEAAKLNAISPYGRTKLFQVRAARMGGHRCSAADCRAKMMSQRREGQQQLKSLRELHRHTGGAWIANTLLGYGLRRRRTCSATSALATRSGVSCCCGEPPLSLR